MKLYRHFTSGLLLVMSVVPTLLAQSAATGSIAGRVTDAKSRLALSGARVTVTGTALETFVAQGGDYVLVNVPAGARSVVVSYVGYPEATQLVTVAAGGVATADVAVGDSTVRMEKFVIAGSAVGAARAINQQRAADTLTNLVAADDIGRFPDQNAAESIQRIPGSRSTATRARDASLWCGASSPTSIRWSSMESVWPRRTAAIARCRSM